MKPAGRQRRARWLVALWAVLLASVVACEPATPPAQRGGAARVAVVSGEAVLQGRLLAPCCWNQTLETHESPLASSLRAEIHERLRGGEASMAIEDDFAARFGERVRAVPRGRDPRTKVPLVMAVGMVLSALGLIWQVRRWTRKARPALAPAPGAEPPAPHARTEYDDRLDRDLRALDDD